MKAKIRLVKADAGLVQALLETPAPEAFDVQVAGQLSTTLAALAQTEEERYKLMFESAPIAINIMLIALREENLAQPEQGLRHKP